MMAESSCNLSRKKMRNFNVNKKPTGYMKVKTQKKPRKKSTRWTYYAEGNVDIPEICIYSLDNQCRQEDSGCSRLHSKEPWHWQFQDEIWYNFPKLQAGQLESSFNDVNKNDVELFPIDPTKMAKLGKIMVKLLGTGKWKADFERMTIMKTNGRTSLKIRRLSTPSAVVSRSEKATVFEWFFKDEKNHWTSFKSKNQQFFPKITSDLIERQYREDSTTLRIIDIADCRFQLDLQSMILKNLETEDEYQLRQRPLVKQLSVKPTEEDISMKNELPSWNLMKGNPMQRIILENTSKEYEHVENLILKVLRKGKVVSIKRIQNPFLWKTFQERQADMLARYHRNKDLNVQTLIHGTKPEYIHTICLKNFCYKLQVETKHPYGRGIYFSNSPEFLYGAIPADAEGRRFLMLAKVIVGKVVRGYSTLVRAPDNPKTGLPYDTTVDDVVAPKVFVKYDSQDCYPEYVIEFQS